MTEVAVETLSDPAVSNAREAIELVLREARCLDRRDWEGWLDLYADDAVYWMPAWKSETQLTDDPAGELSLIYYAGKARLAERVWRVQSGQSVASVPLPRTMHSVTNFLVRRTGTTLIEVNSNWVVHYFDPKRKISHSYFGFYEHVLRAEDDGMWIASKRIELLNDHIPAALDFYMV